MEKPLPSNAQRRSFQPLTAPPSRSFLLPIPPQCWGVEASASKSSFSLSPTLHLSGEQNPVSCVPWAQGTFQQPVGSGFSRWLLNMPTGGIKVKDLISSFPLPPRIGIPIAVDRIKYRHLDIPLGPCPPKGCSYWRKLNFWPRKALTHPNLWPVEGLDLFLSPGLTSHWDSCPSCDLP